MDKKITHEEIMRLEKIYLLNAFKNKHKFFKRIKSNNYNFVISKN